MDYYCEWRRVRDNTTVILEKSLFVHFCRLSGGVEYSAGFNPYESILFISVIHMPNGNQQTARNPLERDREAKIRYIGQKIRNNKSMQPTSNEI